jgi:hypothetical protein
MDADLGPARAGVAVHTGQAGRVVPPARP